MKAVLDANIILGFLLTRGKLTSAIFDYWEKKSFTLLISDEILKEYQEILDRFISAGIVNQKAVESLLTKLGKTAKNVDIISKLQISPDKKDNRYLECAYDGKADYLISRDKRHLLKIVKYKYTRIISAGEFVTILNDKNYTK